MPKKHIFKTQTLAAQFNFNMVIDVKGPVKLHKLQNKLNLPLTLQGSTRSSVSFQECEGSFAEDEFVRQEGDAQVGLVC